MQLYALNPGDCFSDNAGDWFSYMLLMQEIGAVIMLLRIIASMRQ